MLCCCKGNLLTCPSEAAATGRAESSEKICPILAPSSSSIRAMAVGVGKGSSLSCSWDRACRIADLWLLRLCPACKWQKANPFGQTGRTACNIHLTCTT